MQANNFTQVQLCNCKVTTSGPCQCVEADNMSGLAANWSAKPGVPDCHACGAVTTERRFMYKECRWRPVGAFYLPVKLKELF